MAFFSPQSLPVAASSSQVFQYLSALDVVKGVERSLNETREVLHELPTPYQRFIVHEVSVALTFGLLPLTTTYFAFYFQIKGRKRVHDALTAAAVLAYAVWPWVTPVVCPPLRSAQFWAVQVGALKTLDIWMRREKPLRYSAPGKRPSDAVIASLMITELRYESFTPNRIRKARAQEEFSEPRELAIHIGIFMVLQSLPQVYPVILAFEVLLAIYIIFTSIHMLLRYASSPAQFGPLYRAESLAGFWSDTWHNDFTSMCESLAYAPVRFWMPRLGFSTQHARIGGILASFVLMAMFHMVALWPLVPWSGVIRIGVFFILNGVGTIVEAAIWGRQSSWLKTALAWTFEVGLATWTAQSTNIPNGLSQIRWTNLCDPLGSPCRMTPLANEP